MNVLTNEALTREIKRLSRRCKCSKITIIDVEGIVPDPNQPNTIQVLTNGEIWFVACDGQTVLLSTGGAPTIVSADAGNDISAGTDGGAFFQETINVSADAGNDLSTGAEGGAYLDLSTENVALEHFGINIDEGAVVSTGYKGRLIVPYAGTITGWTILETSETPIQGSIVVDVLLGTYANYDTTPTFASIAGTEKPTLTNAEKNQDLTLTTWTTAVVAGDILQFSVDSAATVEKVYVSVHITKT